VLRIISWSHYVGVEIRVHTFLTLALIDMSQKLHAAHCSTLTQWQDPSNHEIDSKVDCRPTYLDNCMEERNFYLAARIWTLAVHFVACHYWLGCHHPGSFLKSKKMYGVHQSLVDTLLQQFSSFSDIQFGKIALWFPRTSDAVYHVSNSVKPV